MSRFSQYFLRLVQPPDEPHLDIRRRLSRLWRWDLTTAHPLLLRLYDTFDCRRMDVQAFEQCLELVESFAVRRTICGVPTNQLKKIFLSLAKGFNEVGTVRWLTGELMKGTAGGRWPKDEEFESAWPQFQVYNPSRLDRCKLILEALEESYGHKEPADLEAATIEHIMPVTLTDAWRAQLGSNAAEIHERSLHTIGNLTLTGYNSELSNLAFAKKKKRLADSHYELNKYFASTTNWTNEQILQRSAALWEKARRIWPRPEG
jgi:hypothetical protein